MHPETKEEPPRYEDPEAHRRGLRRDADLRDGDPERWFPMVHVGQWWASDSRAGFVIASRMFGVVRSSWTDAPVWLRILWLPIWAVIGAALHAGMAASGEIPATLIAAAVAVAGYLATLRLIAVAYPPDKPAS
jgi:hypothetical protein